MKVENKLWSVGGDEGRHEGYVVLKFFSWRWDNEHTKSRAAMWVAVSELPRSVSHPFYEKLNRLLAEHGFDEFVEAQCRPFYAEKMGRPSLAPGQYFRLLLLGYFEGLDSERGMAWRAADSSGVRGVSRAGADRGGAGSFDDIADATIDRFGHPSGGVHVGLQMSGHRGADQGENDCDRCHHARSKRGPAQHRAPRHRGEL